MRSPWTAWCSSYSAAPAQLHGAAGCWLVLRGGCTRGGVFGLQPVGPCTCLATCNDAHGAAPAPTLTAGYGTEASELLYAAARHGHMPVLHLALALLPHADAAAALHSPHHVNARRPLHAAAAGGHTAAVGLLLAVARRRRACKTATAEHLCTTPPTAATLPRWTCCLRWAPRRRRACMTGPTGDRCTPPPLAGMRLRWGSFWTRPRKRCSCKTAAAGHPCIMQRSAATSQYWTCCFRQAPLRSAPRLANARCTWPR